MYRGSRFILIRCHKSDDLTISPTSTSSNNKKKQSVSAQSVEELSLNYRFLNRVLLFLLLLLSLALLTFPSYVYTLNFIFPRGGSTHTFHSQASLAWRGVGLGVGLGGMSRWWSESKHNVNNIRIKS